MINEKLSNIFLPVTLTLLVILAAGRIAAAQSCAEMPPSLFGVTTETATWKNDAETKKGLNRLVNSLKKIESPYKPVIRVVFQYGNEASDYLEALKALHGVNEDCSDRVAYVVGLLVDSQQVFHFNDRHENQSIADRARHFAKTVGKYVDVWEIGNEMNGEWVGWISNNRNNEHHNQSPEELARMRKTVGGQVVEVYKALSCGDPEAETKCALNLYLFDDLNTGKNCRDDTIKGCNAECSREYEMLTWSKNYLEPVKNGLKFDYVFFSFYEDDCKTVEKSPALLADAIKDLSNLFTFGGHKPKVGLGEIAPQCYCSKNKDNDKRRTAKCCRPEQPRFVRRYYGAWHRQIKEMFATLPAAERPDYVGGFFYWYFYQDAATNSKASRRVLEAFRETAKDWR